jgi:hypothetical protein
VVIIACNPVGACRWDYPGNGEITVMLDTVKKSSDSSWTPYTVEWFSINKPGVSTNQGQPGHFSARGNHGQFIYVVPEQRLVMVRCGNLPHAPQKRQGATASSRVRRGFKDQPALFHSRIRRCRIWQGGSDVWLVGRQGCLRVRDGQHHTRPCSTAKRVATARDEVPSLR